MRKIINEKNLIPPHQFGFRNKYATIEQVHRLTNKIYSALKQKKFCTAVFLDIEKVFDKVWHEGLLFKVSQNFHSAYHQFLSSHLENKTFSVKIQDTFSDICNIKADVR